MNDHTLIITFSLKGIDSQILSNFENKLIATVFESNAGEFDGNEVNIKTQECRLFLYSSDVDKLFLIIEPLLSDTFFMNGAMIKKRYGPSSDDVLEKNFEFFCHFPPN